MNCEFCNDNLDEYYDGVMPAEATEKMAAHLVECERCADQYQQHREFRSLMTSVKVDPIAPSAAARLIRSAKLGVEKKEIKQTQRKSFASGFIAAGFLSVIVMLIGNQLKLPSSSSKSLPTLETTAVREVQVYINVPMDMKNANLALELPNYLAVKGYEDLQVISWKTNFAKGVNQLVLPVYVKPGTDLTQVHKIAATIEYKQQSKKFQLHLDLGPDLDRMPEASFRSGTISKQQV